MFYFFFYPGCDLDVPDRIGDDCGREWLDPAMLEEEDDDEEEASNPELLLDDMENGPGKLSSAEVMNTSYTEFLQYSYFVIKRFPVSTLASLNLYES